MFQRWSYEVVLIDVFAIAHFIYWSVQKQQEAEGQVPHFDLVTFNKGNKTVFAQLALGMIKFFDQFQSTEQDVHLLFDNPTSKVVARSQLSPHYKENRKSKMPQAFYRTIDFVQFYCQSTYKENMKTVRVPLREADDTAKVLVEHFKNSSVLCIANDSDWYACLRKEPSVHQWWFTYKGDDAEAIYTPEHFEHEYHFQPTERAVVLMKSLLGDSADCIEGVLQRRDLSQEELLYIINTYQNDAESLATAVSLDPKVSQKVRALLKENRDKYRLNLKLVDRLDTPLSMIQKYTWIGKDNRILREALLKILNSISSSSPMTKEFSFGGVSAYV